ncbi:MAG: 30S ribosomal protein S18 [bacterium]|nr:30S ribosomal protein S18 [bacterium]
MMRREGGARMRKPKRKVCYFCANKIAEIDYKDINILKKHTSERGKILPRRVTGNCAKHQRAVTSAVQRARVIALLPFTA